MMYTNASQFLEACRVDYEHNQHRNSYLGCINGNSYTCSNTHGSWAISSNTDCYNANCDPATGYCIYNFAFLWIIITFFGVLLMFVLGKLGLDWLCIKCGLDDAYGIGYNGEEDEEEEEVEDPPDNLLVQHRGLACGA